MLYRIGLSLVFIGAMMGDSDSLIVPLAIIAMGTALFLLGKAVDQNG